MSLEEIAKIALENPETTAAVAGLSGYSALTYLAGRAQNFKSYNEAQERIEEGFYDSIGDYLKGLYDKGVEHECLAEQEYRESSMDEEESGDIFSYGD